MELRIAVDGRDTDAEALEDWLRHEPQLRGRLRAARTPAADGAMGVSTELVVQVAATVAGASALWAAVGSSLSTWLTQRRSDVTIKVTCPDGHQASLDARRTRDPEELTRVFLDEIHQHAQARTDTVE